MLQFPAKILLFGEYAIVHGESGLALPYTAYSGSLKSIEDQHRNSAASESNLAIRRLWAFLHLNKDLFPWLNLEQMAESLEKGLYFQSNIPRGSGLGSSGALVAALYHQFGNNLQDSPVKMRKALAAIESYFHGSSSGIDPLVSLLNKPVLVKQNEVAVLDDFDLQSLGLSVYLVNTGIFSKTLRLVDWFNTRMQNEQFRKAAEEDFFVYNEALIAAVKQKKQLQMTDLHVLSRYQMETLYPMVPESFRPHFFAGLEHGEFAFKLCGSGGGGYMLCFTRDHILLENYFNREQLSFQAFRY